MLEYDCEWLIDEFGKRSATKELAKKMERFRSLNSVDADLRRCQQTVQAVQQRSDQRTQAEVSTLSDEESLIDQGLGTLAIVLYARSTDSSSPRSRFDATRFYDATRKKWHKGILQLRNQAIAHFGSGIHPGGDWAADRLHMRVDEASSRAALGISWQRAGFRGLAIAHVAELVGLALAGLETDRQKLQAKIFDELNQRGEELNAVLARCPAKVVNDPMMPSPIVQTFIPRIFVMEAEQNGVSH